MMATFYVDASAFPGGDGSTGNPFNTITAAVASAAAGDTIIVRDGIYNESVNINKPVTLLSEHGAASTIINGQGTNPNFSFAVAFNSNDVTFGDVGQGFTVNAGAGETAAMNIGADNLHIEGNVINANADATHLRQAVLGNGGIDNVTFEGNTFGGTASQLVYMNGAQSVGVASTNVDFVN